MNIATTVPRLAAFFSTAGGSHESAKSLIHGLVTSAVYFLRTGTLCVSHGTVQITVYRYNY